MARSEPVPMPQPQALCHFCGRLFTNRQAVRAHLRACQAYRDRHVNEQIARIVRNLGGSRQEADEARGGGTTFARAVPFLWPSRLQERPSGPGAPAGVQGLPGLAP